MDEACVIWTQIEFGSVPLLIGTTKVAGVRDPDWNFSFVPSRSGWGCAGVVSRPEISHFFLFSSGKAPHQRPIPSSWASGKIATTQGHT